MKASWGGRNAHPEALGKRSPFTPTSELGNIDLEVVPVVVPESKGRWESAPAVEPWRNGRAA